MPWWGWLLLAVPFYVFGLLAAWQYKGESFVRSSSERSVVPIKVCWHGCWIVAALCVVAGIVRFVQ